MKIHNLVQGSKEWHQLRDTHLTASDASAMMGASKYKSRTQLMREKKFGIKEDITPAKQALFDKGHAAEDSARNILEVDTLESFSPIVGSDDIDGLKLLASLDGLSEDGQVVFEHKLWNAVLAENVKNRVIEPSHYWQLEHQLLVSGARTVLFMVSDGTAEQRESMFYASLQERRDQLLAGWKQFTDDMASFELEARQEVVVADKASLPSIQYNVKGTEIVTNIGHCLEQIKEMASKEMSKVLETDQDFANKDQLNKDVKNARAGLKEMVSRVRGEFVSYSQFEEVAQQMDSVLQQMQSHGERQVKQAKEAKKQSILNEAARDFELFIVECNGKIRPMYIQSIIQVCPDFEGAMKNKRTIESLTNAVSDELAKCKIEVNQAMDRVINNLQYLRDNASEYKFLFSDAQQLVNQDAEPFQAIIKSRIAVHKQAEEERLEAERKRIQKEEEEKAQREAEAKAEAERERIRNEERAKAQKEAQEIAAGFTSKFKVASESWGDMVKAALNSDDPEITGNIAHQIASTNVDAEYFGFEFDNALSAYDDCYTAIHDHHLEVVIAHAEILELPAQDSIQEAVEVIVEPTNAVDQCASEQVNQKASNSGISAMFKTRILTVASFELESNGDDSALLVIEFSNKSTLDIPISAGMTKARLGLTLVEAMKSLDNM